jgi:MinD-like ATPase involved in chromosome partitioning or flagellar assembly
VSGDRRIIPISSGKGGVGKTTVALNYALSLSRHGRTLLIDLDTGTSSIRNCLDVKVDRDLYHFFKKGYRLEDCATTLDERLDPSGLYRNFAFVAAPRHLIEDITNFTPARREQLIGALNTVDARYLVLDLKAGLDSNVIEFLPYSNSGILVFTPHLPAATLAAADIVKAILFRKLRVLFAPTSPVYGDLAGLTPTFVNTLIDSVEDVYDATVQNLDAFVEDLEHALGAQHPVVRLVTHSVESFVVHYVLNRFDGVKKSYDTAVKPFVESLAESVSAELTILNLGWVVDHEDINESNIKRVPVLLRQDAKPKVTAAPATGAMAELEKLAALHMPGRAAAPVRDKPRVPRAGSAPRAPRSDKYLDTQLDTLRRMFDDVGGANYVDNFSYITSRSLHVMKSRRTSEFGDTRILSAPELQTLLHQGLR